MIASVAPSGPSSGAMNMIAALLEQRTGQQIAANRAWRIETALKPMMRGMGMATLDDLATKLVGSRAGSELADQVIDALLNQETSFFRDITVLDAVADAAQALTQGRKLRIWSAGCSTGQEPLSLAMLFHERSMDTEIIATDISAPALARARKGRFSQFEIQRGLPVRRMMQWFDTVDGDWVCRPELVRKVQFRQHNLAADPAPAGKFDIILCRNVLLYFSASVRRRVFDTLASAIRPGGLLVLGAGETVIGQTDHFRPCEAYRGFYRAVAPAPPASRVTAG